MVLEEEELLLKQLPHSVEAEQAVLGSMLIDPRCVPDVIEQLRPEDFYLRTNREIYETIYSMFNFSLTIDPVTVLENMRKNGVYDENVSRNYILQLMDTTPTAANVGEYVAIIKDKTLLRRIAETAGDMTAMVQQGTDSGQDVLEAYTLLRGRVGHVHLKDRSFVQRNGEGPKVAMDGTPLYPCPVGGGDLPVAEVVSRLKRDGYGGIYTIEHYGASSALDYLRRSIDWVKEQLGD